MQKLCPYRQHFGAGLIYTSKWGSFNILWSSAALLVDDSACFVHPSCLEDISLFRAILKHCTSSSGQWKSNLEFPLTQLSFFSALKQRECASPCYGSRQKAKRRKTAVWERREAKIFKYFNSCASNTAKFFSLFFLSFMVNISTKRKRTFAGGCCTSKTNAMFFFVLVNHLPNSS